MRGDFRQYYLSILLCHSPMLLFSFRILLFPFEFCYSFFWIYYAIMNSFVQFPIGCSAGLAAFLDLEAVFLGDSADMF